MKHAKPLKRHDAHERNWTLTLWLSRPGTKTQYAMGTCELFTDLETARDIADRFFEAGHEAVEMEIT